MSKLQRWTAKWTANKGYPTFHRDRKGEWVKWEDVAPLLLAGRRASGFIARFREDVLKTLDDVQAGEFDNDDMWDGT